MDGQSRIFWQHPWRYRESISIVSGVVVVGFLLQLTVGAVNFSLFRYPVNLFFGCIILLFLFVLSFFRDKMFYRWFSGIPFAVTVIAAMLILALVLGLTPYQSGHLITSSWPFVLVYLLLLLSLGALIIRRLFNFRRKDYAFYLNHTGLWIWLFAAGLGAADLERYLMQVYEGEIEWRASNYKNEIKELPIAIELINFDMEVYPPCPDPNSLPLGEGWGGAKRFMSDIRIYREGKDIDSALLEVNKPCRAGAWMIYQHSYDTSAGKMSKYSVMELVYDPWLIPACIGIWMLAAGSVCMLWAGNKKKEEEKI